MAKQGTRIVRCTCDNQYQDSVYGKNMRVANSCASNNASVKNFRCTVCLKVHSFGEAK